MATTLNYFEQIISHIHKRKELQLLYLNYIPTSNDSLAQLVCYRKMCWCKLKYMAKFHWQIYRAMLSELSKMCSCKWRTLTKWFDKLARCRRGKCDKLFVGWLAFWEWGWGIQLTSSLPVIHTRSSKQMLCVGLEGQRVFEQRGKKESRSYDELLQIKWPKEVKATFSRAMFFCKVGLL